MKKELLWGQQTFYHFFQFGFKLGESLACGFALKTSVNPLHQSVSPDENRRRVSAEANQLRQPDKPVIY